MLAEVTWRSTVRVDSIQQLDEVLDSIARQVDPRRPQAVNVIRANGDCLSIVLGAMGGSILSFNDHSGNPPYYISVGNLSAQGVFTFFVEENHHTEALAMNVISEAQARQALREFVARSSGLPESITWTEV